MHLTTIHGQVITEVKLNGITGMQTATLDLGNQSSGMYFVTVITETESFTAKVVKR